MGLSVKHLRLRLAAGLVLALTGNASAAASDSDRAVLNFKPASAVMRPQTMRPQTTKKSNASFDRSGGVTLDIPIKFVPSQPANSTPLVQSPLAPAQSALPPSQPSTPIVTAPSVTNATRTTTSPVSQGTSPLSNPPVRTQTAPIAEHDHRTTAGVTLPGCPDGKCARGVHQNPNASPVSSRAAGLDAGTYHSVQEKCYSQALLEAAKENVYDRFGNRPRSKGFCAWGVRTSINRAGIYGSNLGNAVDYQARGRAASIGFKNFIGEYGDDMSKIPPGAILVFAGPYTSEYLNTGYEGKKGHKGHWLGHVTIKGDDGKYYTDGREDHPAIGWPQDKTIRRLVGVYLMQQCTSSCSPKLRARCG